MAPYFLLAGGQEMNLDKLFLWTKEYTITGRDGNPTLVNGKEIKVYQRIVGDSELIRARKKALSASRDLRRKLKDRDSEEHKSMIPDYEPLENAGLIEAIALSEVHSLRAEAAKTANYVQKPVAPHSEADLEAFEEYDEALEKYEKEKEEATRKRLTELTQKRTKELENLSREELEDLYVREVASAIAQLEMLKVFNEWCTYMATYLDKKFTQPAFDSFEDFSGASSLLKDQLTASYIDLEVSGDDLKN